jgi:alkylglycerol monooxygenase
MPRETNYIALAIPFFFVFIAIELAVERWRGRRWYRFSDAVTDLGCGVTSQVVNLFFQGALLFPYVWLYNHHKLVDWSGSPAVLWVIALVGVDFLYYWWHRLSHEVNLLWAAHIVHHQSEDYNLAVALRQAVLTAYTVAPFYLPLALLGVPPLVYATSVAISTLYQFWIHTEALGKLGPLELILNTPSHHRVHHARNAEYLDKNYGAILIVWDRLFGTFIEETERPAYGLTKPIQSFNPMWAQVHYLVELAQRSRRAPRLADKIKVWIMSPRWRAEGEVPAPPPYAIHDKYDVPLPDSVRRYVLINFSLVAVITFALLFLISALRPGEGLAIAALVLLALASGGALLEGKRWGLPLELGRLGLSAALVLAWAVNEGRLLVPATAIAMAAALLAVWAIRLPRLPTQLTPAPSEGAWRFAAGAPAYVAHADETSRGGGSN